MAPCRSTCLSRLSLALFVALVQPSECNARPADRSSAVVVNPCPYEAALPDGSIDPVALANRAVHELFFLGRIAEALACHRVALKFVPRGTNPDWAVPIRENVGNLEAMLGPRRPGFPRVYHNVQGREANVVSVARALSLG